MEGTPERWEESIRKRLVAGAIPTANPIAYLVLTNSSGVFDSVRRSIGTDSTGVNPVEICLLHSDFPDFIENEPAQISRVIAPAAVRCAMEILREAVDESFSVILKLPVGNFAETCSAVGLLESHGHSLVGLADFEVSELMPEDQSMTFRVDEVALAARTLSKTFPSLSWIDLDTAEPYAAPESKVNEEPLQENSEPEKAAAERQSHGMAGGSGRQFIIRPPARSGGNPTVSQTDAPTTPPEPATAPGFAGLDHFTDATPPPSPESNPKPNSSDPRIAYRRTLQEKIREAANQG